MSEITNTAASVNAIPATPPPKLTGFHALWLKDSNHVIGWLLVFGLTFILYIVTHITLKSSYQNSPDVQSSIESSLLMYQVTKDRQTNQLKLMHEGQIVDLENLEAGALSLGKLASGRGLIFDAVTRVGNYNDDIEDLLIEIASGFSPVISKAGFFDIPLQLLQFSSKELGELPKQSFVLRVNAGAARPIEIISGDQSGLVRLKRLLGSGVIYDKNLRESASGTTTSLIAGTSKMTGDVKKALEAIVEKSEAAQIQLAHKIVTSISRQEVIAGFEDHLAQLESRIWPYFDTPRPGESKDKSDEACLEKPGETNCHQRQSENFYTKLKLVLNSEVGFFWSFGSWLWVEIIWLAVLGVLTECSIRLGAQYSGRDPENPYWDPRESARTLLKLLSAPIIAIVVIWTLMFTDLIQTETGIEEGGIGIFVPLAFMLGLFPNLGYALLKRLAVAIFTDTSVVKPKKRGSPRKVTVTATQRPGPGEPPDFNALKKKSAEHGAAIIKA